MTSRSSILTRFLLVLIGLAVVLPAQRGAEKGEQGPPDTQIDSRKMARMKAAEQREAEEWAKLTPEERLERRIKRGSKSYCRFIASCKPEKLMPGESGTLVIAALLQGKAVMPSPARVEIMARPLKTPISVGSLMIRPATQGTIAKAYLGRPVYENYAVLEVPVSMAADTKVGEKHLVAMDLKFDLYDGGSAQPVGRFIERVATEIEVGRALDPVVEGRPEPAPEAKQPAVAAPEGAAVGVEPGSGEPSEALGGAASLPGADATPAEAQTSPLASGDGPGLPTAGAEDGGLPMPLLLGGGAILLVIVLLLLLRK